MQTTAPPMSREDIIRHCADILRRRGHRVQTFVECGINNGLKADIVTGSTVYEIRQILDEPKLYEGTGQGQVYRRSLRRRRLVLVGYVPTPDKQGKAFDVAANLEKYDLAGVSYLDLDPFWEIVPLSYQWLKWSVLAVSIIAVSVFSIPLLREEIGCRIEPRLSICASRAERW